MTGADDLAVLRQEAERLATVAHNLLRSSRPINDDREILEEPPSLHLAHYTSLETLVSILQTPGGGLRLSHSSAMNDPEEGLTTTYDKTLYGLLEDNAERMPWIRERYRSAFLCCFVGIREDEERTIDPGDDLLFWRLYGNGCRGISITTAPHRSAKLVESSLVRQVTYAEEAFGRIDVTAILELLRDVDRLRMRALEVALWSDVAEIVLPPCDRLLGERFLRKQIHYRIEREYRAILFNAGTELADRRGARIVSEGTQVQNGLCRRYMQVEELTRRSIITTGTQITIGSNVAERDSVRQMVEDSLRSLDLAPNVVPVRVSEIPYRP